MVQSAYFDEIIVTENQPFVVSMKIGGNKIKVIELDGRHTLDQMLNDLRKEISAIDLALRKILVELNKVTEENFKRLTERCNELNNAQIRFEADVDIGRLRKERDILSQHIGDIKTLTARVQRLEHL